MQGQNERARRFLADEAGLTVIEYAVAGGMVAAAIALAFTALGTTVAGIIGFLVTALQ